MPFCDSCRFCCWSFAVNDVPDRILGITFKPSVSHCDHECEQGCDLHGMDEQPLSCNTFKCLYLKGEEIYRPDTLQGVLEEAKGDLGNYVPCLSTSIPVVEAVQVIRETRSLPAAILVANEWVKVVLPLDRNSDGGWHATESMTAAWERLYKEYGSR